MTGRSGDPGADTRDTAQRVLAAARRTFADEGYAGASIREIASRADVDAALVHYYYRTKENLFVRAVEAEWEGDPAVPSTPVDAETVVRTFLGRWERADVRDRFTAVLRSLGDNERAVELLQEFLCGPILRGLQDSAGRTVAPSRALFVGTQLLGLAILRYLLRAEPFASMPTDGLVEFLKPSIQHVIDDPPGDGEPHPDPPTRLEST
ncbi:MAG: TetR/AcrR family transcriptional regulator [Pseudonocardiaceae bacterium]